MSKIIAILFLITLFLFPVFGSTQSVYISSPQNNPDLLNSGITVEEGYYIYNNVYYNAFQSNKLFNDVFDKNPDLDDGLRDLSRDIQLSSRIGYSALGVGVSVMITGAIMMATGKIDLGMGTMFAGLAGSFFGFVPLISLEQKTKQFVLSFNRQVL